jgi:hypothetical protein
MFSLGSQRSIWDDEKGAEHGASGFGKFSGSAAHEITELQGKKFYLTYVKCNPELYT